MVAVQKISIYYLCLTLILAMTLVSSGGPFWVVRAQPQPSGFDTALESLHDFQQALETLRDSFDHSQFDVDELAFELAFEFSETIIAWAQEHIAFELYAGVLRGAQGTLRSRAGNSFDQALLLAQLLNDAGYEVQIAQTQLTETQAAEVLTQLTEPLYHQVAQAQYQQVAEQLKVVMADRAFAPLIKDELAKMLDLLLNPQPLNSFTDEAQQDYEFIVDTLKQHGVDLAAAGAEETHAELLKEAQQYAWVRYRDSGADAWQDAHPIFTNAPTWELDVLQEFDDELPHEVQHRFHFEVFIEQKLGDTLKETALAPVWDKPTANLADYPLVFWNAPVFQTPSEEQVQTSEEDPAPITNPDKALALWTELEVFDKIDYVVPMLGEEPLVRSNLFDLAGNVLEPALMLNPTAGVIKNVQEGLGGALSAFDSLSFDTPQDEPPPKALGLSRVRMVYTLVEPGGESQRFERTLLDLIDPEERAAGTYHLRDDPQELAKLFDRHTITLSMGRSSALFMVDKQIETLLAQLSKLEYMMQLHYGVADRSVTAIADTLATFYESPDPSPLGPLLLYNAFDAFESAQQSYRHRPGLFVIREGTLLSGGEQEIDIMSNARRAYDQGVYQPLAMLKHGVWDTFIERDVLRDDAEVFSLLAGEPVREYNTPLLFAQAEAEGITPVVLTPQDSDAVTALTLPAESQEAIARDLAQGFTVIVPERLPDAATWAGWWRVDTQSGETLGMMRDGRGQAFSEYVTKLKAVAIKTITSIRSLMGTTNGLLFLNPATVVACAYTIMNRYHANFSSDASALCNTVFTCLGVTVSMNGTHPIIASANGSGLLLFFIGVALVIATLEVC